MREAKSYKVMMNHSAGGNFKVTQRMYWQAPGTFRMESDVTAPRKNQVHIVSADGPGIELTPADKIFRRLPARQGQRSLLLTPESLKKFSGQADRVLPEKEVAGRKLPGFELDAKKVDPDIFPGTLQVWFDPDTNLPAYIDYAFTLTDTPGKGTVVWHDFEWNVPLDPKLFDVTPPPGYTDMTQAAVPLAEQVEQIRAALSAYAALAKGEYPRVKLVFGDVTRDKMLEICSKWPA
jgi:outer membrane lipoprotein-sorting protein